MLTASWDVTASHHINIVPHSTHISTHHTPHTSAHSTHTTHISTHNTHQHTPHTTHISTLHTHHTHQHTSAHTTHISTHHTHQHTVTHRTLNVANNPWQMPHVAVQMVGLVLSAPLQSVMGCALCNVWCCNVRYTLSIHMLISARQTETVIQCAWKQCVNERTHQLP